MISALRTVARRADAATIGRRVVNLFILAHGITVQAIDQKLLAGQAHYTTFSAAEDVTWMQLDTGGADALDAALSRVLMGLDARLATLDAG